MTRASKAAPDEQQRVHVPERSVPGAEFEIVVDEGGRPAPAPATEEVLVLDFGGQYSQLIARRVRECGVFSELLPHDTPLKRIRERAPKGLVLSGGPASVYAKGAPKLRRELLDLEIPVMGICYGMQLMVHDLGGRVEEAPRGEFGRTTLTVREHGALLAGTPDEQQCWMSHRDTVFEPRVAGRRLRGRRAWPLWDPVPPGGRPHPLRQRDPHPLPPRRRRRP